MSADPTDAPRAYAAVVVAVSTGGIEALRILLADLQADFPLAMIVVLHTAADSLQGVCELLQPISALPIHEAAIQGRAEAGHVYLAPPGYHLLIEPDQRFSLSMDAKVCHVRPSADVLFESAADAWGAALIGVVLTGANDDGAAGLRRVRDFGGLAVVQSPDDAQMPTMPEAALRLAGADHVVPLRQLGALLNALAARR